MNQRQTVFSQLTDFMPIHLFRRCVAQYNGDHKVQHFTCWNQFLAMIFALLTYRESLGDIEACLHAQASKCYHMGLRSNVSRNNLANANAIRDWRIYADFAQALISIARRLYLHDPIGIDLQETIYALDSTTIDLCLSLFPWAKFRRRKGAIKLHTLMDLRGNIPTFIYFSHGKMVDVHVLDVLLPEHGAFCTQEGDQSFKIKNDTGRYGIALAARGLVIDPTMPGSLVGTRRLVLGFNRASSNASINFIYE